MSATTPVANVTAGCADAAAGLERGTMGLREPETSVLATMRTRCLEDRWTVDAIACFAQLTGAQSATSASDDHGGLDTCGGKLAEDDRERMFAALGGSSGRLALEVTRIRLARLQVGIAECDRFVTTVSAVLSCEAMALETRVQLGAETADFWSLPTSRLTPEAQARMAAVCGKSLADLQQQASAAGCMP